jgi:hypothetical protein
MLIAPKRFQSRYPRAQLLFLMSGAPHDQDPFEVDDPTQPFSRQKIEDLRRAAEHRRATAASIDPELRGDEYVVSSDPDMDRTLEQLDDGSDEQWLEVSGRFICVSLQAFDDICLGRKRPAGMVTSADASLAQGEIGWDPLDGSDGAMEWSVVAGSRRKRLFALVTISIALVLAVWGGLRLSSDDVATTGEPDWSEQSTRVDPVPAQDDHRPSTSPDPVVDQEPALDPPPTGEDARNADPACAHRRKQAHNAKQRGDWTRLEELARRKGCWSRPDLALALQMEALFELERHEDCVRIGANSKSEDIQIWVSNCRRASQ